MLPSARQVTIEPERISGSPGLGPATLMRLFCAQLRRHTGGRTGPAYGPHTGHKARIAIRAPDGPRIRACGPRMRACYVLQCTHLHTGTANTGRRRGDRTQTGTRTSRHHRRITPQRTTSPNISRRSTRTNLRAARQTPRSPASASPYAGRPLRRARRRQGWRRAPGSA